MITFLKSWENLRKNYVLVGCREKSSVAANSASRTPQAAQEMLAGCRQHHPPQSVDQYLNLRDIDDETPLTPQTSYGAQKAIGELMINDYSRKGFFDGRSLRLPTIVVRPGKPNRAASGFASSIIREPLQGDPINCPVTADTRMLVLSPRRAVQAFIDVHNADAHKLGLRRGVMMNGISPSIGEMIEALKEIAGNKVVDRISWNPDEEVQWMVDSWPWFANGNRGHSLGFKPDDSIQSVFGSLLPKFPKQQCSSTIKTFNFIINIIFKWTRIFSRSRS